jgi:hypothetical protein
MKVSKHKPIYMTRTDWSMDEISIAQAINSFKGYFDYLDDLNTTSNKRKESVYGNKTEAFSRHSKMGDSDKVGRDKADGFDVFGKKSSGNSYNMTEKNAIKDKHKLEFSEFLKYCSPYNNKSDEISVNRFYSIFHKRRSSLVRCL